jgi:hypothetical protein
MKRTISEEQVKTADELEDYFCNMSPPLALTDDDMLWMWWFAIRWVLNTSCSEDELNIGLTKQATATAKLAEECLRRYQFHYQKWLKQNPA